MTPMPTRRSSRGFTLTEVLIAIAILVSMTVVVWGALGISFRSRDQMTQSFDQFQTLRQAMDRMTRELSTAFIAAHGNRKENLPDPKGLLDVVNSAGNSTVEDAINQESDRQLAQAEADQQGRDHYIETAFVGKNDEVHFTALAHVRTSPDEISSDQCEISYFVRTSRRRNKDGNLVRELVRREDITLDDDVEDGGVIYTLIDEVEEVKFEYWRPGKEGDEEDGGKWVNDWDSRKSEQRGTLPTRVKITVTVHRPGNDDARNTRTFTTQAQIMMTQILDY